MLELISHSIQPFFVTMLFVVGLIMTMIIIIRFNKFLSRYHTLAR